MCHCVLSSASVRYSNRSERRQRYRRPRPADRLGAYTISATTGGLIQRKWLSIPVRDTHARHAKWMPYRCLLSLARAISGSRLQTMRDLVPHCTYRLSSQYGERIETETACRFAIMREREKMTLYPMTHLGEEQRPFILCDLSWYCRAPLARH